MHKFFLGLAATAAVAFQVSAANADVFDWTYTDGGVVNTGSGTLTATATGSPGQYTVTAISGTANGFTINSLTDYAGQDQLVYWVPPSPTSPTHFDPANPFYHLDFDGVAFIGPDGKAFNFYEDAFNSSIPAYRCDAAYCLIGPGAPGTDGVSTDDNIVGLTDFALSRVDVPEPFTLSLFGAGVAAAAAMRRRKAKKA
jgi:hypothetical protein